MNNQTFYITAGEKDFKNKTLDNLLAKGYYRMQHLMFTCNDTPVSEDGYAIPVFWRNPWKCRRERLLKSSFAIVNTYISTLPKETLQNLLRDGIIQCSLLKKPIFEYIT